MKLVGFLGFMLIAFSAAAETPVQMVFEEYVAPDLKANVMIVGDPTLRETAKNNVQKAAKHAREILDRLDPLDPASEVSALMTKKEKGTFPVSPDLVKILYNAQQVATRLKEPFAKQIVVNLSKNEISLKSGDVSINIEPLLKGYLADVIIEDLLQAGWRDSFLELEGIFAARGQDFNGPWKIPVVDNTTASAHHAFFFKTSGNVSAATVNNRTKNTNAPNDLKSVTVFSEEGACRAQGIAAAAFASGLDNAKKMLKIAGNSRSVLIDQNGKFLHFPEAK